ncbi:MAG: hypothetical protein J5793_05075 [Clostridia bacterium]|nr:hypothetical protein [Clostridia bacterium]
MTKKNKDGKRFDPKIPKAFVASVLTGLILLAAAIGFTAYAEYTKSSRAKRVVSSQDSTGALFSSNYLFQFSGVENEIDNYRTLYTSEATAAVSTRLTVCNYSQGNPGRPYEFDISYVLTAKLVTLNHGVITQVANGTDIGGRTVTIVPHDDPSSAITLSSSNTSASFPAYTLSSTAAEADLFNLTMSSEFNTAEGDYYLYLRATPTVSRHDIYPIDCLFDSAVSHEQQAITWEGYINESGALGDASGASPDEYDGFRYIIAGSGAGTVRLSWDPAVFEISQYFLISASSTALVPSTDPTGWYYIEFGVDSDVKNRYELQFYYAEGVAGTLTDWDDVTDAVNFVYTAASGGEESE